jgi:hypothetical protein
MLAFFLYECPSSMIPPRDEMAAWALPLAERGDEFAHAKGYTKWSEEGG